MIKKAVSDKIKTVPYDIPNGKSKSGKIAVRFPNSSARDKGVKAINDGTFLSDLGYNCRDATKMLPKVTLYDIPSFFYWVMMKPTKQRHKFVMRKTLQLSVKSVLKIRIFIIMLTQDIHFRLFIWVK